MAIDSPKLIFGPHIPKCAGISFAHFLMEIFGKENVLLYYNNLFFVKSEKSKSETANIVYGTPPFLYRLGKSLVQSRYACSLMRLLSNYTSSSPFEIKTIPKGARRVVHGHFRVHPKLVGQVDLAIVLREPLDRVASLFRYLQNESRSGRRTPVWFDPSQPVEKFILLPQNVGTYSRFLNRIRLEDCKYIGVTENLHELCRSFDPEGKILIKHKNQSPKLNLILQGSTIEQFKKRNFSDYELYNQALDLISERAGESNLIAARPS
jgi:hypothetical protein